MKAFCLCLQLIQKGLSSIKLEKPMALFAQPSDWQMIDGKSASKDTMKR
jgi:hypothetical protein